MCAGNAGGRWRASLTQHGYAFVQHVVHCPDVGGPVGVAEASLEGKEPGQNLRELTLKQQERDLVDLDLSSVSPSSSVKG